jgi:hypothetical protein
VKYDNHDKKKKNEEDEKVPGDVLGLSDENPNVKLPHPPSDGSTPRGIEVGEEKRHSGTEDLRPAKVVGGAVEREDL